MKKIITATIPLIIIISGLMFIGNDEPVIKIVSSEPGKNIVRVDQIMSDYYKKPVNFERLNRMLADSLDMVIKQAGY